MNQLTYQDFLSQGIPLIVTIVAIMGDTWDKSQKGLNKLTRTGWVVVGLIVFIGLPLSFYTMNKSKITLIESENIHIISEEDHNKLNETLHETLIGVGSLKENIAGIQDSLQTIIKYAEGNLQTAITNSEGNLRSTITGAEGSLQTVITTSEGNLNSTMMKTESNLRTAIKDSEGKLESAMKNANDRLKTEIEKILKSYIDSLKIKLAVKPDSLE